ncbi:MAG: ATP-binding protein [Draconibacterium sp.]
MTEQPRYILVIQSSKTELQKVEAFLKSIFENHQLSEACLKKSFLCVSEAVINSIIHGNKNIVSRKITVIVDYLHQSIFFSITDEGDGFDIENIPDPTLGINLKKESGRGIHIIKSLSSFVRFNQKENSLQFKIQCK